MLASATASGTHHVQPSDNDISYDYAQDWLLDRELLTDWQIQLVDCCHEINEQLTQIRQGLEVLNAPDKQPVRPVTLRLVRD